MRHSTGDAAQFASATKRAGTHEDLATACRPHFSHARLPSNHLAGGTHIQGTLAAVARTRVKLPCAWTLAFKVRVKPSFSKDLRLRSMQAAAGFFATNGVEEDGLRMVHGPAS
jgi:hypothetical protein